MANPPPLTGPPRHPFIPPISPPPPPPSFVRAAATTQTPFSIHPSLNSPLHSPSLAFGLPHSHTVARSRSPSLAVACSRSPSLAHRRSLSVFCSVDFRLPRRFDCRFLATTPIRLTVLHAGHSSIRVRARVQLIHPSTSGYYADSTVDFRLPCQFDSPYVLRAVKPHSASAITPSSLTLLRLSRRQASPCFGYHAVKPSPCFGYHAVKPHRPTNFTGCPTPSHFTGCSPYHWARPPNFTGCPSLASLIRPFASLIRPFASLTQSSSSHSLPLPSYSHPPFLRRL